MDADDIYPIISSLGWNFTDLYEKRKEGGIPISSVFAVGIFGEGLSMKRISSRESKGIAKGSVTVEAAFIVPLALLVILTVLSLCFYVHNRAWYTAAAAETAVSAGTEGVRQGNDYWTVIEEKAKSLRGADGFPDSSQGMSANGSDSAVEVRVEADISLWMNSSILKIRIKEGIKIVRPVKFIRKIQALEIITEEL